MNETGECLTPKGLGKARFSKSSCDGFYNGAICTLCFAILLGTIPSTVTTFNTTLGEMIVPFMTNELATLVLLERFDLSTSETFSPSLECQESVKSIRLAFERVTGVEIARIVVIANKVLETRWRLNRHLDKITMNQIE
jgi:hypothetical protein